MSCGCGRMNCSLWAAIKRGYVKQMVRYCRSWGWRYFWLDTFPFLDCKLTHHQFHYVFAPIVCAVWSIIMAGLAATVVYFLYS